MIEISANQYLTDMAYIYCSERAEVGMVQKVSREETGNGKMVQLSGFFLEKKLDDKIVYPTFYGSGEITAVLRRMIETYKEDIAIEIQLARDTGSKVDFQATGDELSKKVYEVLHTQEMSYRVTYDYLNNKLLLMFYKGEDKTQDSDSDSFITFSTSWHNIQNSIVDVDHSNYKNFFIVAGIGEAEERITVEVDLSNGGYKKKLFVDSRNTQYDSKEQTLEQYKLELRQQGLEKALDYEIIENVSFTVIPSGYKYLEDYDLGTKCDVMIDDIGMSFQTRIIAIYEVFKEGKHEIELEVGNQIKSNYQTLRI